MIYLDTQVSSLMKKSITFLTKKTDNKNEVIEERKWNQEKWKKERIRGKKAEVKRERLENEQCLLSQEHSFECNSDLLYNSFLTIHLHQD